MRRASTAGVRDLRQKGFCRQAAGERKKSLMQLRSRWRGCTIKTYLITYSVQHTDECAVVGVGLLVGQLGRSLSALDKQA